MFTLSLSLILVELQRWDPPTPEPVAEQCCLFSSLSDSTSLSSAGIFKDGFPRISVSMFQDANVKLIRELREEIDRLKTLLMSFELVRRNASQL